MPRLKWILVCRGFLAPRKCFDFPTFFRNPFILKLGILDYGGGNLRSVINAFKAVDCPAELITCPEQMESLDLLIFPGQGSFGDSVRQLKASGLWEPLKDWLAAKKPYIGICLGYQLLFESSDESPGVEGLGVFPGKVVKFQAKPGLKIPHMGWNQVKFSSTLSGVWEGLDCDDTYYFVHSFYPEPKDSALAACLTDYEGEFASGVVVDRLFAVQFHPEKSQQAGLKLLKEAVKRLGATS